MFNFIPAPKDASQAAFQVRVFERGVKLLEEGYSIHFGYDQFPGVEHMQSCCVIINPEFQSYKVNFGAGKESCTCECFGKNRFCKHIICALLEDARREEAAQIASLEWEAKRFGWTE